MYSKASSVFCIIRHSFEFWCNLMLSFDSQINDEDVSLRVNTEFQHGYLGEPLDVEFSYNRLEKSSHLHACVYISPGNIKKCNQSALLALADWPWGGVTMHLNRQNISERVSEVLFQLLLALSDTTWRHNSHFQVNLKLMFSTTSQQVWRLNFL